MTGDDPENANGCGFRQAGACGLSRKACVVLAVVAVALMIGLAAGLAKGLKRDSTSGGPPQDIKPSELPAGSLLPPAPPPGLPYNATCGVDFECASNFCFINICAQTRTVVDYDACDDSKQCRSGVCDSNYRKCRLALGKTCLISIIGQFCASYKCAKNNTCIQ